MIYYDEVLDGVRLTWRVLFLTSAGSIREIIAFPKVQNSSDPMTEAPQQVALKQLEELGIAVAAPASATETQVGNGIDFSVVVDDNENSEYEVLYRINSNQISLTDNNTYTLISFEIGEYVFEAYLVTSDNEEVILARKTVSAIADTPTDVPSLEPTVTPSEEPTNTPDITDAPTPRSYVISLCNNNRCVY